MKKNFLFTIVGCFLLICATSVNSKAQENPKLTKLFEDYRQFLMEQYPEWATYLGDHRYNDRLTDNSEEGQRARAKRVLQFFFLARDIEEDKLNESDALNYNLFLQELGRSLKSDQWGYHYMPLNQLGGLHLSFPGLVEVQPLKTYDDYKKYFARLEAFPNRVDNAIANMRTGMEQRLVQPQFVMQKVLEQIESFVKTPVDSSVFVKPIRNRENELNDAQKKEVQTKLNKLVETQIMPAYNKLHDFIETDYLPVCRNDDGVGIWTLPNGFERYGYEVQNHTTTNLSPDDIFDMGMDEVERIKAEMEKVKSKIGFEGSLADFIHFLRTNKQFYYTDAQDMMKGYQKILDDAQKQLPDLFGKLPKTPCELKEIEAYRAASAPQAYYYHPPEDGSRPGYFYVNTSKLDSRPKYTMTALTLHEAVPGHHLQVALAQESKGLPWFRQHASSYTAYTEGWGLYAEFLGFEMGMYEDDYQHFGALTFEMWRACRLVVDVGLHHKQWSREKAVQFMLENTPNSEADIRAEVDRYVVWPGQALAYKIGQLKITELRENAELALGDKFDLKAFHDLLLKNGAVPLNELEKSVNRWMIDSAK